MAGPRDNDEFTNGLLMGLLLAGSVGGDGPDEGELEYYLERFGRGLPFPLRFKRRRQRLADLEERVKSVESRYERVAASMGSFAWALSAGARPDDMDQLVALPVRVYLEVAGSFPAGLVLAAQRFVGELGFDVVATGDPEQGSFRQRFVSALRGFFSKKEAQDAMEKGARAIEIMLLDGPQAQATQALAEATAKLLEQVKDQKGAVCLQVGSILLVRYRPKGKRDFVTTSRTLSAVQLRRLEENQSQLDKPDSILQWLGAATSGRLQEPE